MAFEAGPYIQAACLCDMVLEDKTGVLSLIRIVDSLTHVEGGANPPNEMPPFVHTLKLVVMLKSGMARGRSEMSIVPELPTGATIDPLIITVHFAGEERGHNVVADLAFQYTVEGLYWFNIYLEGQKLTAIPLRVKYNRVIAGPVRPG